jgi:5'-AMP-activated protein kinase catalytic alpha subunit
MDVIVIIDNEDYDPLVNDDSVKIVKYQKIGTIKHSLYGSVQKVKHKNKLSALKKSSKKRMEANRILNDNPYREATILKRITGECCFIVEYLDDFEDYKYHYLFTSFAEGMELFDYVKTNPSLPLDLEVISVIFCQLVLATDFLHSNNITHGDISLENIIIDDLYNIKLIDFGVARDHNKSRNKKVHIGKTSYNAPELFHSNYNRLSELGEVIIDAKKCDVWATGIALFLLTTGYSPFEKAVFSNNIFRILINGELELHYENLNWTKHMTPDLIDLLTKLLSHPCKRPPIGEIMTHPWIQ